MENGFIALAKMFKKNENIVQIGNIVGRVISTNPIKISILDGNIVLEKEQLYICHSLESNYTRQFSTGNLQGETNSVNDGGDNASNHSHSIESLSGTITFIDALNLNDEVLLLPTVDEQKWFIVDKITKL